MVRLSNVTFFNYFARRSGLRSIVMSTSVCVCVRACACVSVGLCVRVHTSQTIRAIVNKFLLYVAYRSVLLRRAIAIPRGRGNFGSFLPH